MKLTPTERMQALEDLHPEALQFRPLHNLATVSCVIRQSKPDFQVKERLSFEPTGEGEHLFLELQKQGCNTDWLARQLQKFFQLRSQDVGYAGKKDRHSLSSQWFSLHLPGKTVTDEQLEEFLESLKERARDDESVQILTATRHNKKLRMGAISHNAFRLTLRELSSPLDKKQIEVISEHGFANYYGYQRFGHNGENLRKALASFRGELKVKSRNLRGIYLSSARSFWFNCWLEQRLQDGTLERPLPGDCYNLDASASYFHQADIDDELLARMASGDIHVSGWLPGRGRSEATGDALAVEQSITEQLTELVEGCDKARVEAARRSSRIIPIDLVYQPIDATTGQLDFCLPAGVFATSLLQEVVNITDASLAAVEKP